jgi:hypothetical protein
MESALERGILLLTMIFFWAWVVYVVLQWRKMKHKNQLQNKIVEKFNDVQGLNDFFQSESGNKFIDFLTVKGLAPKEKLLSSIKAGVILLVLGIAFFFVGSFFSELSVEIRILKGIAILIIALGAGFLISSFISSFLSKKWGLIDKD